MKCVIDIHFVLIPSANVQQSNENLVLERNEISLKFLFSTLQIAPYGTICFEKWNHQLSSFLRSKHFLFE